MVSRDPLNPLRQRAYRYTLEDGLADILAGVYTITVGAATQNRGLLALAVVYLAVYAMAWRWMHDQLVSHRTGYAELGEQPPRVLLTGSLAAATVTLIAVAVVTLSSGTLWNLASWPAWAPVLAGVILAAGFLQTAWRSGLWRYRAYGAASIVGSAFFWLFPFGPAINPSDRLTLFLFLIGAIVLATGIGIVVRFRRAHPLETSGGNDGR